MLGFTPFKKHANKFNYTPRYYDPDKEAREQRRAELRGQRSDMSDAEYRPGQFIRARREARQQQRKPKAQPRHRVWVYLVIALLALLFIQKIYPTLADLFIKSNQKHRIEQSAEYGDFDPSAPITIIPNDAQEGE